MVQLTSAATTLKQATLHRGESVMRMKSCSVIAGIVPLFIASAAVAADPTRIVDDERGLAVRDSVEIPFTLINVPSNPELRLKFKVDSKGSCPITYKPTVVSVNGQRVGAIDFRTHWWKDEPKLKVPPGVLKTGENVVQITMGSCQYGVDAMRLNKLTLVE